MYSWKKIKINGIANISKCVGEFEIGELNKTPYSKFKIKIYEDIEGKYTGYTNLLLKDDSGCGFPGVGHGNTIEEALESTIQYFLEMLSEKNMLCENDFECADSFDF